ncbi:hypothetical protein ACJX0J_012266, partial [Zea mays]
RTQIAHWPVGLLAHMLPITSLDPMASVLVGDYWALGGTGTYYICFLIKAISDSTSVGPLRNYMLKN